jgi:hypothetical protein
MDSIYIVQSWFEDYESTSWKIIGTFTEKKLAEDIANKWKDFYEEKSIVFSMNQKTGFLLNQIWNMVMGG